VIRKLHFSSLLLLAACAASGSETGRTAADSVLAEGALAVPTVAYRLPASGGALSVYALPSLEQRPWGAGGRIAGVGAALGTDLIGRRLLYRDSAGAVTSFDLVALRERTAARQAALTAMGPDGTLLVLDSSGAITESQPWGQRAWSGSIGRGARDAFVGPGQRLIVIRRGRQADSLLFVARDAGVTAATQVPAGGDPVASRDGDAVAFATDSGIVVYEERALDEPWFVRTDGRARLAEFSPSGHRIFVALEGDDALAVIDRFGRAARGSIGLDSPAEQLRFDPWGRVLLVLGGDGETMIISMAGNERLGEVRTSWSSDLPTISENGVLLLREGTAVVARDARSLDSLGAVAGGAADVWFAGRWVATSATAALRADVQQRSSGSGQRAAGSGQQAPGSGQPSDARAPLPVARSFYAQLAATRDEGAARQMASELGRSVQVVPPRQNDDMWRVMAGPFSTREAADSAGRSLGRSYWVVDRTGEPRRQ